LRQLNHHMGHLCRFNFGAFSSVADFAVLAETAQQIAGTDEDGARAMGSHKRRLFAEVGVAAGRGSFPACLTEAPFALQAIDAASPRAKTAFFQDRHGFFGSLFENAFFK